ncbi:hypothetical protein AKKGGB_AKKGGB_04550, partial [Dysosmobacter welbionis]
GILHKLVPGGEQLLGALDLHRQLGPQLVQQIQQLVPVHHAHIGFQGRGLGVLDPLVQHIDQTVHIIC